MQPSMTVINTHITGTINYSLYNILITVMVIIETYYILFCAYTGTLLNNYDSTVVTTIYR